MAIDEAQYSALLGDVRAEADQLIELLSGLDDEQWHLPTPAVGWDIHDQVVHLAFFDDLAVLGFAHPEEFETTKDALLATGEDWVDQISHDRHDLSPAEVLRWFSASRENLLLRFAELGPEARTPWFGPPMSSASSATARLMETWAHGQDLFDTFGLRREPTARLRHVCHLGVITRGFSFALRGLEVPQTPVRVELVAPDGSPWTWGPEDAVDRVSGPAHDFALVVTQRRHRADTGLVITPGPAEEWMSIAQAFAGSPGAGRQPGQFPAEGSRR